MATTRPAPESSSPPPSCPRLGKLALAALAAGVDVEDVHAYVTRRPDRLEGLAKLVDES